AITSVNPGVNFPDKDIIVVHRSDGSGTTFIWTDYLSKISPEWESKVGRNTSVQWPIGLGGKGNEGVAGSIRQLSGAIGYVELIYAVQNNIPYGVVRNSAGNFVKASLESVTAAAASAPKMPADFRVSITNAPGKDAYPISSFTWLLVPEQSKNAANAKILVDFLKWMMTDGQKMTSALSYAPLPENVVQKEKEAIKLVR
ncbi:MAG: phosphate ABC transporter substrate-binding protein PstS, partial [Candidatus Sulfotelmatobacter sp.]